MKPLRSSLPVFRRLTLAASMVAAVAFSPAVQAELVTPRISPKASAMQQIGITDLSVTYSRPGVKGRTIWGELVPYDKPWRAGANEPTTFTTTDEITVGGQALAAGSYAVVAIPTKDTWTIAFSKQKDLMGTSNYDEKQDAARVSVKPSAGESQEWLSWTFEDVTPGFPYPITNTCAAGKQKAVAEATFAKLECFEEAFRREPGIVADDCFARPETQFAYTWAKLESNGGCLTTGDAEMLDAKINTFVADIVTSLDPD